MRLFSSPLSLLLALLFLGTTLPAQGLHSITGELMTWHPVTLTFLGPKCSETGTPNPFSDYRLTVTFTQGSQRYDVPGFFAADGEAAYTSATSGNKWRVIFSPPSPGKWIYEVEFVKGKNIAVSDEPGEWAGDLDGESGGLIISPSNKTGRDFRAHGRLEYIEEHYLRFAGSGNYFVKCGTDAPENLLAYEGFDQTPNVGDRRKDWAAHAADFDAESAKKYLWGKKRDKGKNILGALQYLHNKGLNAFSFLTFNVDGDDKNVFPHLLRNSLKDYEETARTKGKRVCWENEIIHDRFDVSKLDQWNQVFSFGQTLGLFLHFKTQETENDQKMDGGEVDYERKLYYRELIARFGHHLALNWNLGEENTQTTAQRKAAIEYISDLDPYDHPIVVHTYPNAYDKVYGPLLGEGSQLAGPSLQANQSDFHDVPGLVATWVQESQNAGRKWVVSVDEPGDASHALVPDSDDPAHDNARVHALWGTLMHGGAGVEWYFGYQHAHSDLTCQDFRSRDHFWDQCRVALRIFNEENLPLTEMQNMNDLTPGKDDWVLAKPGEVYLIYCLKGGPIKFATPSPGFRFQYINPRTGERKPPIPIEVGDGDDWACPSEEDWLLLIRK